MANRGTNHQIFIDNDNYELLKKRSEKKRLSTSAYIAACMKAPELLEESEEDTIFTAIDHKHADEIEELLYDNSIPYNRTNLEFITRLTHESMQIISGYTSVGIDNKPASKNNASYKAIKEFIADKYGCKVSNLDIAQAKRKNGLYMISKKTDDDRKVPQCTPEHEKMIIDALIHLGAITEDDLS